MATITCPACGHENEEDRATCENCGVNFARLASQKKPKPKKRLRGLVIILALAALGLCGIILSLPGSDDEPASAPTTQAFAPAHEVFVSNYDSMTDAQWEAFAAEVTGSRVNNWTGVVSEVDKGEITGDYTVYVRVDGEAIASVYIPVEADVGLSLNRGDNIIFSGTISLADNSLGLTIRLRDATIAVQ